METHEDVNEQQNEKPGIPVHINKRYEQNNINRRHGDKLNNPNERKPGENMTNWIIITKRASGPNMTCLQELLGTQGCVLDSNKPGKALCS